MPIPSVEDCHAKKGGKPAYGAITIQTALLVFGDGWVLVWMDAAHEQIVVVIDRS